jgi:hypothetical protein
MVYKNIYAAVIVLTLIAEPCSADGSSRHNAADNQTMPWYAINCFSLKQGSGLRNARFRLHDNEKLEFVVQGENLRTTKATYAYDGIRFSAAIDFSLHKGKPYRYALSFTGIRAFETFAGLARLQEYIDNGKLSQEILFLFIASREAESKPAQKLPFL